MNEVIGVLFLAANPLGTAQLNLSREIREINEKLRSTQYRDSLDLVSWWAVRPSDLMDAIYREQPTIVHFSGHGASSGELILEDQLGNPKPVPPEAIKSLFASLTGKVRLVFLNSCFSKAQAGAIAESIECTIAMNSSVSDEVAIVFSAAFYRAIGYGQSIKGAFDQAKSALLLEGLADDIPELICSSGVDPALVTLITPPSVTRTVSSSSSPLDFVHLEMATDECLWEEITHNRAPEAPAFGFTGKPWFGQTYAVPPKQYYPFGSHQLANYHWPTEQLKSDHRTPDPIFDFTVVNRSDGPLVVSRIGILPVNAWSAPKAAPSGFKLMDFDGYELTISEFVIDKELSIVLPSPIYIEKDAPYRFRLRLRDFTRGVQNDPELSLNEFVVKIAVTADNKSYYSEEIYLGLIQVDVTN